MKTLIDHMDTILGRVLLREDEDSYHLTVGRRDINIKKNGEFLGSGYYVGEDREEWEIAHKKFLKKIREA